VEVRHDVDVHVRSWRRRSSTAPRRLRGRLCPADLTQAAADKCRLVLGTAAGPGHPLWSMQLDVCREVLARGGLPAALGLLSVMITGRLHGWAGNCCQPLDFVLPIDFR
jgi:hypothetical protein